MKRIRVLVVDDDPVVAESIRMTLGDLGYDVVSTATSGEEAIERAREHGPDLVLMDIGLPGNLDGIEAAVRIHKELKTPVVYLSACADREHIERARTSCAHGYVLKPFRTEQLHAVLQMALHRTHLEELQTAELQRTNQRLEREIAERERAENTLRQRERKYRHIAEKVSDNIWILRLSDLKVDYSSPSVEKLLGYSPQEVMGEEARRLLTAESFETMCRAIDEGLAREGEAGESQDRSMVFQMELIRKDARRVWMEITASFLRDAKGEPDRVLGVTRDITERKQVEAFLRSSEEKYRVVVENAIEGIFVSQDWVIRYANPAVSRITGYSPGELAKGPYIEFVHPEDRDRLLAVHQKRIEGHGVPSGHTFRIIKKDGSHAWVEVGATRIVWEGKAATLNFVRDVTETKRLRRQLQEAQKMEAVGTLAGGIAHDFNNILQIILGYAELGRQDIQENDSLSAILQEVIYAGKRGRDLANKILTFSRNAEQEARPIELVGSVRETLLFLRASLPTTISLREDFHFESGFVLGDPSGISQILINLCSNSAHAMLPAGGELIVGLAQVHLDTDRAALYPELAPGAYLNLTVSDTGHGIDPSALGRIFEPFFTTKAPGEGTGLGLAVVHGIVKSHGGAIRVASEVGKGTTFRVLLPRIESDADSSTEKEEDTEKRSAKSCSLTTRSAWSISTVRLSNGWATRLAPWGAAGRHWTPSNRTRTTMTS